MRVIQVLPALYRGDAIGNTTLAIRDILKEEGYETFICTEEKGPGMEAEALGIPYAGGLGMLVENMVERQEAG